MELGTTDFDGSKGRGNSQDVVYIGDSLEKDIYPARAEGILTIAFNETESVVLDVTDFRVDSLRKLETILIHSHTCSSFDHDRCA